MISILFVNRVSQANEVPPDSGIGDLIDKIDRIDRLIDARHAAYRLEMIPVQVAASSGRGPSFA